MKSVLDISEIKKILPHRYPFLLLDKVLELNLNKNIIALKNVTINEDFFNGHFPQKPVMPGVLIIESLAQVGATLLLAHKDYQGKIAYFTGIKSAKIRKQVLPGDTLVLHVFLTRLKGPFGFGEAKAYVGEQLAVEAEFSFAVQ